MRAANVDHAFIARTLGPGVLEAAVEGRLRDVFVSLLANHHDLVTETDEGALFVLALALRIRAASSSSDTFVPAGRIGKLDLGRGCYTGYEVFRIAAHDLVRRGLAGRIAALLRTRRQTVREFLTERYGVAMGKREYWHDSRWTADQADLKEFLRMLTSPRGI